MRMRRKKIQDITDLTADIGSYLKMISNMFWEANYLDFLEPQILIPLTSAAVAKNQAETIAGLLGSCGGR